MTEEQFEEKQRSMPLNELIELAEKQIHDLIESGGKSINMCVPPQITDTDMVLCEVVRRLKVSVLKTVYVLEYQGEEYISDDKNDITSELESMLPCSIGEHFKVFTKEITQEEFDNLPEFDGF